MRVASFAKYVPEGRVAVADCVTATGAHPIEAKAFARLFGIDWVAATDPDMTLGAAFGRVLDGLVVQDTLPDTVIYVHGNPVQYADDDHPLAGSLEDHPLLAQVHDVFEMDQQNCSTLFWALDAAQRLLDDGAARCVAVLAGDSLHRMPLGERYAPGVTAIGDAFCGLLLDDRPGGLRIDDIWLGIRTAHHAGRFGTPAQNAAFNDDHPALVQAILTGIGLDDADGRDGDTPILPHNVNRLSWTRFAKTTGTDMGRIWLDLLPGQGHCYTVDAVSMLDRFAASGRALATMLSVGQGGFLGGCQIRAEAA